MTFSYDETDLSMELNRIRLELGDTDEDDALLQNEEIAQVQTEQSTFYRRVASCCRLICAKIAKKVNYKLSRLSEDASILYDRYKEMEKMFSAKTSTNYPWVGSIKTDLKADVEANTNLVKARFKRGQMDNV